MGEDSSWREYIEGLCRSVKQRKAAIAWRQKQGMAYARKATELLVQHFGAHQVYVFGSLTNPNRFNEYSDIDLAVTGLKPADYFPALREIEKITEAFSFHLLTLEDAEENLARKIKERGELLWPLPPS